jgi:chromosome segregation ATPase
MTLPSVLLVVVTVATIGCRGAYDNSADTDRSSHELQQAQSQVTANSRALTSNEAEIERTKRELLAGQQALADKQALLDQQRLQLGSAQGDLQAAHVAYAAATKERFAKLDAKLAALATKTDARSRDALTGLRARRDQLSGKLAAMAGAAQPSGDQNIRDIDTTFDAIEHDLGDAPR